MAVFIVANWYGLMLICSFLVQFGLGGNSLQTLQAISGLTEVNMQTQRVQGGLGQFLPYLRLGVEKGRMR